MYGSVGILGMWMLSKFDYIKINWAKIIQDSFYLMIRSNTGESGFFSYIKRFITHVIPLGFGFGTGLKYAFDHTEMIPFLASTNSGL